MPLDDADKQWIDERLDGMRDRLIETMRGMQTEMLREIESKLGRPMKTLEAPFEMAPLFPKTTGLPFIVWISEHGNASHDVRVKAANGPQAIHMASVTVRPNVRLVEGAMAAENLELLKSWIELNRRVLVEYWDSEIDTAEAINRLLRVRA